MKKNIWFIMGGTMLISILLVLIIQSCMFTSTPTPPTIPETSVSQIPTPTPTEVVPTSTSTRTPTPLPTLTPTPTLRPSTSTPTPTEPGPTSTSTRTPTPLPTSTPTLMPTPTPLPDVVARQQLEPFVEQMQETDAVVRETAPVILGQDECPYASPGSGECWIYHTSFGTLFLFQGYAPLINLHIYDLDDDGQPEILKWDLGRDERIDVIEFDVDGDGVLNYAIADLNGNGQFDNDEIYSYQPAAEDWQPLIPGAPPFPVLPIFPY